MSNLKRIEAMQFFANDLESVFDTKVHVHQHGKLLSSATTTKSCRSL